MPSDTDWDISLVLGAQQGNGGRCESHYEWEEGELS